MASRRVSSEVVSPLYATLGPAPGYARRVAGSAAGGERILKDWRAWRADYGEQWDDGLVGTPPPPHHEKFSGYAH